MIGSVPLPLIRISSPVSALLNARMNYECLEKLEMYAESQGRQVVECDLGIKSDAVAATPRDSDKVALDATPLLDSITFIT